MATITLQFWRKDYPSLQVGDTAYYSSTTSNAGFNTNEDDNGNTNVTKIGLVKSIDNTTTLNSEYNGYETTTLTCEIGDATPAPTTSDFVFFSKDNKVNTTSLLGYYASVKFFNKSEEKAELFSIGCEIAESSK